jgi:hypothetical protein
MFNYNVTFTIPSVQRASNARWGGWSHTIDINFVDMDGIILELQVRLHECGALQQVKINEDEDEYHDYELDEDEVDNLFEITPVSPEEWDELGQTDRGNLSDLLEARDRIVEQEEKGNLEKWAAMIRAYGGSYLEPDGIDDGYIGQYKKLCDYARIRMDELLNNSGDMSGELKSLIQAHFDFDSYASDLESELYYDEETGHLWS